MLTFYYDYFCKVGLHFGGLKSKDKNINFQSYPSILGKRSNLIVVDLRHTIYTLRISLFFLIKVVTLRGKILGIENREFLRSFFMFFFGKARQFFFHRKWLAGFLTNFKYFQSFAKSIQNQRASPKLLEEYSDYFLGVERLKRMPTFVIFNEANENLAAHSEAARLGIPHVSFYDFFDNTSGITFPVPGSALGDDSVYFLSKLYYGSILIGNYKEIHFFFRKNLYLTKLSREKFFATSSFYTLRSGDALKIKKIFLKKIYRSAAKIKKKKKGLKKKFSKKFRKKNSFFHQFYRKFLRKFSNERRVFQRRHRLDQLNKFSFLKSYKTQALNVSRLTYLINKKYLKYLSFKMFKYFKSNKKIFFNCDLRKKLKDLASLKNLKRKKIKRPLKFFKRSNILLKKFYFNSYNLLNFFLQKYSLKHKKITILLSRNDVFNKIKLYKNFDLNYVLKLRIKKIKEKKIKQRKKKRFLRFLKRRFRRFKLKKFLHSKPRRRRRGRLKSAALKYLPQFFIFRRRVLLNKSISFVRPRISFSKFEIFTPYRLRSWFIKKYMKKKYLLKQIRH